MKTEDEIREHLEAREAEVRLAWRDVDLDREPWLDDAYCRALRWVLDE